MVRDYSNLMTEVSKIRPKRRPRNYFEVLQHMKSNDSRVYGRRCVGTLNHGHMGQYWIRPNDSIKNHISLHHSCYATINAFKRGGSLIKNKRTGQKYYWFHHNDKLVTGLYGLYADLDAKNIGMQYGSQLIPLYPHLLDIADLPEPSFVIDSGHGIHILWLFNSEVVIHKYSILAMWQKVEDLFVHRLAKASLDLVGTSKLVDSKVHDATRYLRIPGSYNCKGGHRLYVKTLEDNWISYSLTGYHCGLYYDYIGQYSQKWVNYQLRRRLWAKKDNKSNEKASASKGVSSGLVKRNQGLGKFAYLLMNRLADYKELIKVRNHEHVYSGYRNILMFHYGVDRIRLNSKHSLLHDALAVNRMFHNPLSLDEIKKIFRLNSNQNTPLMKYRYTNAMVMKHLNISSKEQQLMKTLTDTKERQIRHQIANSKSIIRNRNWRKRHGLIGSITKKKWQRKKLVDKAIRLSKTTSKTVTARVIGISRMTLDRWFKKYKV